MHDNDILSSQYTVNGELFLRVHEEDRLLFVSNDDLRALKHSNSWACDDIFSVAPNGDGQLYTLHALVNGCHWSGTTHAFTRFFLVAVKLITITFGQQFKSSAENRILANCLQVEL